MPHPNPDAMAFLLSRRSRPAKTLRAPAPDRTALEPILTAAARSPDHGKLEPWRFVVLERGALDRLAALVEERGPELGQDADQIAKAASAYRDSQLAVVVVEVQKPSVKIPAIDDLFRRCSVPCSVERGAGLGLGGELALGLGQS